MTDTANRGQAVVPIYAAAAKDYWQSGWQPLPLPRGCKSSPPPGYTGGDGKIVGLRTLEGWIKNPRSAVGNLALHLLHPIIGIDVDTYDTDGGTKNGTASLRAAEAALGPLPPTLISTARGETISPLESGIRFYRLPDSSPPLTPDAERVIREQFGPGIEIISMAYRYVLAWPSTNPDANGAIYRWYVASADGGIEPVEGVPDRELIALLPQEWAELWAGHGQEPANGGGTLLPRSGAEGARRTDQYDQDAFTPVAHDATLAELGIAIPDPSIRIYASIEQIEDEIGQWLDRVRSSRRAGRGGTLCINEALRDCAAHLWHFVPNFITSEQWKECLLEAQRQAWIASGEADDGDYTAAKVTLARTVDTYVPDQVRRGLWWTASLGDDAGETIGGKDHAPAETNGNGRGHGIDWSDVEWINNGNNDNGVPTNGASANGNGVPTNGAVSLAAAPDVAGGVLLPGPQNGAADGPPVTADGPPDARDSLEQLRAERRKQERLQELQRVVEAEEIRRKARQVLDEREINRPANPERKRRLREEMFTSSELDAIEDLAPLIDGWLWKGTLAQMFGPSGHYKSFVAADMARAVCTGEPWHGRPTAQGKVIYICAEGVAGFRRRVRAMESYRGLGRLDNMIVVRRAVQIGGDEWPEFCEIVAEEQAALVVVDTQARNTIGRKENQSDDMGIVIKALDLLITKTDACVLMIHHSGKGESSDGRGSSAVKGALETQIRVVKRQGLTVEITATKQKDHEELGPHYLQLEPHDESLVITGNHVVDGMAPDRTEEREKEERQLTRAIDVNDIAAMRIDGAIMRTIHAVFGGGSGGTKAEIRASYDDFRRKGGKDPVNRNTFNSAWSKLEKAGYLLQNPGFARFLLSLEGCRSIGTEFERPVWITPEEWEEAIHRESGKILKPVDDGTEIHNGDGLDAGTLPGDAMLELK